MMIRKFCCPSISSLLQPNTGSLIKFYRYVLDNSENCWYDVYSLIFDE